MLHLIKAEKQRLLRRDPSYYGKGRVSGLNFVGNLYKGLPVGFCEEDVVAVIEKLNNKISDGRKLLANTSTGEIKAITEGAIKSMMCCVKFLENLMLDMHRDYFPITEQQRKVVGIVSSKTMKEFYGLSSLEARQFIDENGEEK